MAEQPQKIAVLIAGATASGKSALAMELARARGGIIINADALQVYRDIPILSARPGPVDEAEIAHRLYGHVAGSDAYSVARWLAEATGELHRAWVSGKTPIVVGGTGLYFRALEKGLSETPAIAQEIREKWRSFAGDLHGELARRDPEGAARLEPADRQRLVRALEVFDATGHPLAYWQGLASERSILAHVTIERHFVEVPRGELYLRAERRFDAMMAAGALDEVRRLLSLSPALPMMKAIGVPELSAHLRGEASLDNAVLRAKQASRNYIKRQLTWWRGQGRYWFEKGAQ